MVYVRPKYTIVAVPRTYHASDVGRSYRYIPSAPDRRTMLRLNQRALLMTTVAPAMGWPRVSVTRPLTTPALGAGAGLGGVGVGVGVGAGEGEGTGVEAVGGVESVPHAFDAASSASSSVCRHRGAALCAWCMRTSRGWEQVRRTVRGGAGVLHVARRCDPSRGSFGGGRSTHLARCASCEGPG